MSVLSNLKGVPSNTLYFHWPSCNHPTIPSSVGRSASSAETGRHAGLAGWLARGEVEGTQEAVWLYCTSQHTQTTPVCQLSDVAGDMSSRLVLVLSDLFIPDRAIVSILSPATAVRHRPS